MLRACRSGVMFCGVLPVAPPERRGESAQAQKRPAEAGNPDAPCFQDSNRQARVQGPWTRAAPQSQVAITPRCADPVLQATTMDAPATQAPMTYVEQSTTGTTAWREWDDSPGCSLCKCCGDCACDCERGWCAPRVVMARCMQAHRRCRQGAADRAATQCAGACAA